MNFGKRTSSCDWRRWIRFQGQSPCSASKLGADKLAECLYCAYQLPVVAVWPFNTYGPRQSARAVIPTMITQALIGGAVRVGNWDGIRKLTWIAA